MDSPALQAIPARSATIGDRSAPTLALLVAITAGVVAQGGFYLPGRILVTVLALVALVVALVVTRPRAGDLRDLRAPGIAAAAIAGWALLRAAAQGGLAGAGGIALALLTLLAGVVAARRARPADLALGLTGLGALVAATAWAGVALRIGRWSVLVESTLYRGASTLTYPNAAAAVLAAAALLALARVLAEPASRARVLALFLILAGLGATLSRAGGIALTAGVLVMLAFAPDRRLLVRRLLPPALGAAVAVAALVPSFPVDAAPAPLVALAGLAAGAGIALLRPLPALGLAAAGATGALLLRPSTLDAVLRRRLTLASQGRSGAWHSALEQAGAHLWLGRGPGQARYFWFDFQGRLVVSRWVHNEYLQWLVDLGIVGLVLLLALLAALAPGLRRGFARTPLWAGAVAAIAALAVHSAFDFLWELAVVPLVLGVLAGMAGPHHGEESAPPSNGEVTQ
ncbi:O-antigen ligase family protein [Dactylosporangium sp. CA-052675]|uniref:O-antigen ligase family protein n=1 Tax=Dactylosporangium sp. CA-052675 TaxID=3239927 RepID=UPI003D8C6832